MTVTEAKIYVYLRKQQQQQQQPDANSYIDIIVTGTESHLKLKT